MNPKIFLTRPMRVGSICTIYPPTVEEVIDSVLFSHFVSYLTMTQEEVWDQIVGQESVSVDNLQNAMQTSVTPFEMLMIGAHEDNQTKAIIEKAFLFFTREQVLILPDQRKIIFKNSVVEQSVAATMDDSKFRVIDESNYFLIQNIIREAIGQPQEEAPDPNENPRIARIKAKARARDKAKQKNKAKRGLTLTTTLAALCCGEMGLNPMNIGGIGYATASLLFNTMQNKIQYENDIQFLAGGADPKKLKVKYWITEIEENHN